MSRVSRVLSLAVGLTVLSGGTGSAVEYGTLTGKFVFEGVAPAPKKLIPNKDQAVCGKHDIFAERLLVKDGAFADVVICALGDVNDPLIPIKNIHPDYDKLKSTPVVLDNKACRFDPHVAILWTEQKLVIKNSDGGIGHNTFATCFNNSSFNYLIPDGGSVDVTTLKKGEKSPVKVNCNIHPWMEGHVVVRPDPYAAVSKPDGTFAIENIPVGKHSFRLWNDGLGYLSKVTIGGAAAAHRQGVYPIEIKAGKNDIGTITVKAADYTTKINMLK